MGLTRVRVFASVNSGHAGGVGGQRMFKTSLDIIALQEWTVLRRYRFEFHHSSNAYFQHSSSNTLVCVYTNMRMAGICARTG